MSLPEEYLRVRVYWIEYTTDEKPQQIKVAREVSEATPSSFHTWETFDKDFSSTKWPSYLAARVREWGKNAMYLNKKWVRTGEKRELDRKIVSCITAISSGAIPMDNIVSIHQTITVMMIASFFLWMDKKHYMDNGVLVKGHICEYFEASTTNES